MRSARQALADIAALCDESQAATNEYETRDRERAPWAYLGTVHTALVNVPEVRAVLADVEPEPAVVWDRDAAREVLVWKYKVSIGDEVLDALEGCVRPATQHTIDPDDLMDLMARARGRGGLKLPELRDQILALLRPVDGVTLTREEAADIARVLRNTGGRDVLAARLEAAS